MKKLLILTFIFIIIFLAYFAVGTKLTFKPKWALDYFNPMAQSLIDLRLDIQNPASTYDLSYYYGKWYLPSGPLPALFFIPFHLILGRFFPSLYLSIFFASLNTVLFYLILKRIKKEFLPQISNFSIFAFLTLFAFGTTHFYVGTLGSSWHVEQMVSAFLETLGIYVIFKKERKIRDYLLSSIIFCLALIGRPTTTLLLSLPVTLFFFQFFSFKKTTDFAKKFFIALGLPLLIFSAIFFTYNYLRFSNPFEYGFSYIHESPYLAKIREQNGNLSFKNFGTNLWYLLFEIPSISLKENLKFNFNFNLNGNSIFFLTPPLLTIFLASPISFRRRKISFNPYLTSLWLAVMITIMPSLLHYSTGWIQFGYRYTLDIIVLLVILSIFGIKGRLNFLYLIGIVFSIIMYLWGIFSIQ